MKCVADSVFRSLSYLGVLLLTPQVWAASPTVGQATLVIGQARIVGLDGTMTPAQVGTPVRVGDKIETQAGGHVYLRFVDGANLSVRPMSRMWIESYSHHPQQPQLGAIKFKLEEGVARSITGAWGEAARDRFRLNTPVAAIGVRGTDFTVRSDPERTTATVYTGAIVFAPLSNGCAQTVGPCQTSAATLLSGDMRGQMLELASRDNAMPLLVANTTSVRAARPTPVAAVELVASLGKAVMPDSVEARHDTNTSTIKTIGAETRGVAVAQMEVPAPPTPVPVPMPEPPAHLPTPTPEPTPPPVAQTPAPIPDVPVAVAPAEPPPPITPMGPPEVKQLAWAKFPWTPSPNADADAFLIAFTQAATAGLERVGSDGAYALMRLPTSQGTTSMSTGSTPTHNIPSDTIVNFRLAQATAHLLPERWLAPQSVAVLGGNFQVDFSRAMFQTSLALQNNQIGYQSIQSSGDILANGNLKATSGDASLFGVLTTDRQEAAYAFEKLIPAGALRGVTLWGR